MLTCVYSAEKFKTKAVTVKLEQSDESKKKTRLLTVEKRPGIAKSETPILLPDKNELPVGGGGAVLVLSELESMAARQQREITLQRRLLEQREARLAVLRGAQEPAQQERLARLRHRLDQQQSKLNRLRLLRSQTEQSRANNATLTSDLDCIRALFNEKEKELSLAVAKVEELTRQLEELRGRHNGNAVGGGVGGQVPSTASAELEKLRRELMYRNKMNEQQNQVVSQQRLVLAQRQAEMVSIDARIAQLQGRLQRKRALNQRLLSQQIANNRQTSSASTTTTSSTTTTMTPCITDQVSKQQDFTNAPKLRPAGNIAAIEPYSHIPNDNDFNLNKNDPKYQTLPYNTKFAVNLKPIEDDVNKNKIQHSQSASQINQRSNIQQMGHSISHSQSQSHIQAQSQLGINPSSVQHLQSAQYSSSQSFTTQSGNFTVHCPKNTTNNNTTTSTNNNNNIVNNNNNNSVNNNNNINNSNDNNSGNNINIDNNVNNNNNSSGNVSNNNSNNGSSNNNLQINGNNSGLVNVTQENQNQSILRHQNHQQISSNTQQKQLSKNLSSNIDNLDLKQSTTQAHNFKNLQNHQKPVSSVAPSFPVKSPIYQTSSTKIHPVMPQTLSLISRAHSGLQSYSEQSNTPHSNVQNQQQIIVTTESSYPTRHAFQQGQFPQNYKNSTNFPQTGLTNLANFPGYSSSNITQTQNINSIQENSNIDRVKFDAKSQEKHENQQIKSFDNNKHDQVTQARFEGSTKPDSIQPLKFDHTQLSMTHQYGKLDQVDGKSTSKYDHNTQYKHESHKYDATSNFQQFKQPQQQLQDQGKYDVSTTKAEIASQKYETNQQSMKHDHNTKLEPPTKLSDKPYEYERTNTETERKTINQFESKSEDKMKPALPPKPIKPSPPPRLNSQDKLEVSADTTTEGKSSISPRSEKEEEIPPIPTSEPPESPNETVLGNHQVIKARPLTSKKTFLSEQPRLRYPKSNVHVSINRRIEMPPAFLFPETEIPADLKLTEQPQQQQQQQQQQTQSTPNITDVTDHSNIKSISVLIADEPSNDKLEDSDIVEALNVINIEDKLKIKDSDKKHDLEADSKSIEVIRRKKGNLKSTTGKANLSRRVSFDPLALLLDASLEGELELVKKTAKEVANPSSANDEGITALHNAICAGHLDIVKFLVEFGCDVNAQDSDGWTPLHCAASCNNLAMVRFLVEHGACIFATTLSDHETAAEKCEEDEEGFDGCSEYLYSVQEKLGIMNNGQVFAVFDYEAQHSDELSLKNGDQLVILRKGDDNEREWWWSRLGHREGYVPRNLLGLYPRVQPAKTE
ncbi:apoptosis-stimulating of p53 protein 1 isoform X2 [Chelonus insularis]|uniref:apoptosis-stimulating of p53 protein 1 isoform X2 n=1 Tax=Chelonus insularis TaxID=460826 RepID=UPI00158D794C|nr:apoptosis-stimulating of p53 protein 1-like isoform X2 [Chelonus insularis]XP_034947181.1 apoptosis-stimulating of p53 protein 1-like isoform X2 [Chelonus insularis]XP_034947182.1 apoptosis-stimulating of p53 protein 1-like isoform X2 [Chelonus insularis]XP_034947183.1 apoptosis-stimulating of p53 protein 1-like isoform X2 [Chelonus insularis]